MPTKKTIVTIQAHPDDAEIYCAGTLSLLADQGHRLVIATMTSGGMGGFGTNEATTRATRKKEAKAAAAIIGAEYISLDERDGYLFDGPDIRTRTTELIRSSGADIVLTHLPDDYHPDHRATGSIVEAATLLTTLPNVPCQATPLEQTPVLYHTTPFTLTNHLGLPYRPTCYIDITPAIKTKRAMIDSHTSQVETMRRMFNKEHFVEDMLNDHDRKLGQQAGVEYAEAYQLHRGGGYPQTPLLEELLAEACISAG